MGRYTMYRKIVSLIVLLSFIPYLGGCTSMRYVSREEMSELEQKPSVWVIMADGTQFEIKRPKIQGSRLVGHVDKKGYKEIEFSEIESLGIKEPDRRKTLLLGMIGLTGVVVLIMVLSDSSEESEPCST